MIHALVVSRLNDSRRRQRIAGAAPPALAWSFLDATDGHHPEMIPREYAALVPLQFWGGSQIKPGVFGCFVSHYRAWCACLDSGVPTMVLEDDATFSGQSTALISALQPLIEQGSYDVLFVNRRTVEWLRLHLAYRKFAFLPHRSLRAFVAIRVARRLKSGGTAKLRALSLRTVVEGIVRADILPSSHDTVGGECYVVTPNGARKLIERADRHGASVGVDWFILGSGMPGLCAGSAWSMPAEAAKCFVSEPPVNIGVTTQWLVQAEDREVGGSSIDHSRYADLQGYGARVGSR